MERLKALILDGIEDRFGAVIDLWAYDAEVVAGAVLSAALTNTSEIHNILVSQNTNASGDKRRSVVYLTRGIYTLKYVYATGSTSGIIDIKLEDDSGVLSTLYTGLDQYTAGSTFNVTLTISGVIISSNGNYYISTTVTGKNGSSSAFVVFQTEFQITKVNS